MKWRKLGLLYAPSGDRAWARAHAMLPTPLPLTHNRVRVYLAHTDDNTIGRLGFIDVSLDDPMRILDEAKRPILDVGEPGTFDDNGINPCSITRIGDSVRLYYAGYQLQRRIPYTLFTGLAVASDPDGPFRRVSKCPILDRTDGELYVRSGPCVLHENGRWRMWYTAGSGWTDSAGKALPKYSLRHIESVDGVVWKGGGVECLTPEEPEIGFGRPFVIKQGPQYRIWYSIRTRVGYSIGYATSPDGLKWTRRDSEVGIEASLDGWDSEMICYTAIVPYHDKLVMFYNGNGYGRTGVGVAVSEVSE